MLFLNYVQTFCFSFVSNKKVHYFPFSGNLKTAEYVELNVFSENADFLNENKKKC